MIKKIVNYTGKDIIASVDGQEIVIPSVGQIQVKDYFTIEKSSNIQGLTVKNLQMSLPTELPVEDGTIYVVPVTIAMCIHRDDIYVNMANKNGSELVHFSGLY